MRTAVPEGTAVFFDKENICEWGLWGNMAVNGNYMEVIRGSLRNWLALTVFFTIILG